MSTLGNTIEIFAYLVIIAFSEKVAASFQCDIRSMEWRNGFCFQDRKFLTDLWSRHSLPQDSRCVTRVENSLPMKCHICQGGRWQELSCPEEIILPRPVGMHVPLERIWRIISLPQTVTSHLKMGQWHYRHGIRRKRSASYGSSPYGGSTRQISSHQFHSARQNPTLLRVWSPQLGRYVYIQARLPSGVYQRQNVNYPYPHFPSQSWPRGQGHYGQRQPGSNTNGFPPYNGGGIPPIQKNRKPSIKCPDDISATADEGKVTAVVKWATIKAEDEEDGELKPILVTAQGSGSDFGIGRHNVVYEAVDSEGARTRCGFDVNVKVTLCPPVPRKPGLLHDCRVSGIIYGKKCNFHCVGGYDLVGSKTVKCTKKGVFDNEVPHCRRKKCPKLVVPPGGKYFHCSDANLAGSVCYIECDTQQGFVTHYGRNSLHCGPHGKWMRTAMCVDVQPPEFTECPWKGIVAFVDNGKTTAIAKWQEPMATDNSGTVEITQVQGQRSGSEFSLGEHQVVYLAQDSRQNRAPRPCAFKVAVLLRRCSPPPWIQNQYIKMKCSQGFLQGSTCAITCSMGIELKGSSELTCELDGDSQMMYWKMAEGPPQCEPAECNDPAAPDHAMFSCARTPQGRLCRMECEDGYDFPRTMDAGRLNKCSVRDGQWSMPNPPGCLPIKPPSQLRLPVEAIFKGRCQNAADSQRFQTQLSNHFSNTPWQSSIQNFRCSCMRPQIGMPYPQPPARFPDFRPGVPQDPYFRQPMPPIMGPRIQLVPIVFHWAFATDFAMPPMMGPNEAYQHNAGILHNMATEVETDLQTSFGETDLDGMTFESFTIEGAPEIDCPDGMKPANDQATCRACPPGTYVTDTDLCQSCPPDTYQDEEAQFECKPCPQGTTTNVPAAASLDECEAQEDAVIDGQPPIDSVTLVNPGEFDDLDLRDSLTSDLDAETNSQNNTNMPRDAPGTSRDVTDSPDPEKRPADSPEPEVTKDKPNVENKDSKPDVPQTDPSDSNSGSVNLKPSTAGPGDTDPRGSETLPAGSSDPEITRDPPNAEEPEESKPEVPQADPSDSSPDNKRDKPKEKPQTNPDVKKDTSLSTPSSDSADQDVVDDSPRGNPRTDAPDPSKKEVPQDSPTAQPNNPQTTLPPLETEEGRTTLLKEESSGEVSPKETSKDSGAESRVIDVIEMPIETPKERTEAPPKVRRILPPFPPVPFKRIITDEDAFLSSQN